MHRKGCKLSVHVYFTLIVMLIFTFSLDIPHHQRDPTVPADSVQNRASSQGTST